MNTYEEILAHFNYNQELTMAYMLRILPEFRYGIKLP